MSVVGHPEVSSLRSRKIIPIRPFLDMQDRVGERDLALPLAMLDAKKIPNTPEWLKTAGSSDLVVVSEPVEGRWLFSQDEAREIAQKGHPTI